MQTDSTAFNLVLAPLTEQEFFDEYWEKDPLHISRSDNQYFAKLASLHTIETLLSTQSLQYPAVQLTRSGNTIAVSDYTDELNRILPLRLIEEHDNGATIVISQAHEKIPALADFRRNIQRDFRLQCQTNLYLSPPLQQGFNAHYDSHDVFILQVQGLKTFNFYEGGVELPFRHDSFNTEHHKAGKLTQSITLHPGDTLYIPRGVMHDAVAGTDIDATRISTPSVSSLHITLGIYAITQRDLLLEVVQQITIEDLSFRKSVPRGWITNDNADDAQTVLNEPMPSPQLTDDSFSRALATLLDRAAVESSPECYGLLNYATQENPFNRDETTPNLTETKTAFAGFQLQLANVLSTDRTSEQLRIRTHGSVLEFNETSKTIVEILLAGNASSVSQLADFTEEEIQPVFQSLMAANLLKKSDS